MTEEDRLFQQRLLGRMTEALQEWFPTSLSEDQRSLLRPLLRMAMQEAIPLAQRLRQSGMPEQEVLAECSRQAIQTLLSQQQQDDLQNLAPQSFQKEEAPRMV